MRSHAPSKQDDRQECPHCSRRRKAGAAGLQTSQLKSVEDLANQSPRVQGIAQLQERLNRGPATNRTGMSDGLKAGLESLSGLDLSSVRVHYDSPKPAQLQAHAYTQGQDIYVASGQEGYLPHEGWHVVQQMQGRVQPTLQAHGLALNDDAALEREADVMGAKAASGTGLFAARPPELRDGSTPPGVPVQRAKVVQVPREGGAYEDYVVVDVPADGSCLIHAFNLGFSARDIAQNLIAMQEAGLGMRFTPDEVEREVLSTFHRYACDAFRGESDLETEAWKDPFGALGRKTRRAIALEWRNNPGAHLASLKADIQAILHRLMENEGLLRREPDASSADLRTDIEAPLSAAAPPSAPAEMTDFDFAFNAVYFPNRLKQIPPPDKSSHGASLSSALFGVTKDEVMSMRVPMGVDETGALARLLRDYVVALATPHAVGDYVPLQALAVPPAAHIPDAIVEAYVAEFGENMSLWSSETALRSAIAGAPSRVSLHSFDLEDRHVASRHLPGGDERVHLYEFGDQAHFETMIGPFPPGWLRPEGMADEEAWSQKDEEELSGGEEEDFEEAMEAGEFEPVSEPEELLYRYFDTESSGLSFPDVSYLNEVVTRLEEDFGSPGEVAQLIYRAAAELGVPDVFSQPAEWAVEVVQDYRSRALEASSGGHSASRREPIVPLAGFVPELVDRFKIPIEEIDRLLPHAQAYLSFHKTYKSWREPQAAERVTALRELARILNEWAETYQAPELRRGPSIAEFTTAPSPLARSEVVGTGMRSLLTLDPGELAGYEPEDSVTWKELSDPIGGFVRAHLLNKHLGGPGKPKNIGYLSNEDNTRMSELGEEYVKREVIENNRQMFYAVQMPPGKADLAKEPYHLAPSFAALMANEVRMKAAFVEPFVDEKGEPDLEFTPTYLKGILGNLDPDVKESNEGMLSFTTRLPHPENVSKRQAHHRKRMRSAEGRASDTSVDTWTLPPPAQEIMKDAQRRILGTKSPDERRMIMDGAKKGLESLISPADLEQAMQKLGDVARQAGSVEAAHSRKRLKTSVKAMQPRRRSFLASTGKDLPQGLKEKVNEASGPMFERILELVKLGAAPEEAVVYGTGTKKQYQHFKEGLRRKKRGIDIESLLRK